MKIKGLILGVGINDADYTVEIKQTVIVDGEKRRKRQWSCPYYKVWAHMIVRCYDQQFKDRNPTYKDCTVCEEWLTFSNFKSWMEKQDWEGKQLDKDLLVRGNKHYSPKTSCFISPAVNKFILEGEASRGEFPIGVYFDKSKDRFCARCNNPFTGKQENLGLFEDPITAHAVWLSRKLEFAKRLSEKESSEIIIRALIERYENYS